MLVVTFAAFEYRFFLYIYVFIVILIQPDIFIKYLLNINLSLTKKGIIAKHQCNEQQLFFVTVIFVVFGGVLIFGYFVCYCGFFLLSFSFLCYHNNWSFNRQFRLILYKVTVVSIFDKLNFLLLAYIFISLEYIIQFKTLNSCTLCWCMYKLWKFYI